MKVVHGEDLVKTYHIIKIKKIRKTTLTLFFMARGDIFYMRIIL